MAMKLGFVHTSVAIANMFKPMIAERLSGTDTFHIADESLIQDLLKAGGFTPTILRRCCMQIGLAEDAGADLIMVTCSSIAPAVDAARPMVNVPVMKVDEPMAEKAVSLSDRIGVMATAETTLGPSVKLIEDKATEAGKSVSVHSILNSEAFRCFFKGDMQAHDRLVLESARQMTGKVGAIVLAQASMGHLAPAIGELAGVPVLTSPPLAMDALVERVRS